MLDSGHFSQGLSWKGNGHHCYCSDHDATLNVRGSKKQRKVLLLLTHFCRFSLGDMTCKTDGCFASCEPCCGHMASSCFKFHPGHMTASLGSSFMHFVKYLLLFREVSREKVRHKYKIALFSVAFYFCIHVYYVHFFPQMSWYVYVFAELQWCYFRSVHSEINRLCYFTDMWLYGVSDYRAAFFHLVLFAFILSE